MPCAPSADKLILERQDCIPSDACSLLADLLHCPTKTNIHNTTVRLSLLYISFSDNPFEMIYGAVMTDFCRSQNEIDWIALLKLLVRKCSHFIPVSLCTDLFPLIRSRSNLIDPFASLVKSISKHISPSDFKECIPESMLGFFSYPIANYNNIAIITPIMRNAYIHYPHSVEHFYNSIIPHPLSATSAFYEFIDFILQHKISIPNQIVTSEFFENIGYADTNDYEALFSALVTAINIDNSIAGLTQNYHVISIFVDFSRSSLKRYNSLPHATFIKFCRTVIPFFDITEATDIDIFFIEYIRKVFQIDQQVVKHELVMLLSLENIRAIFIQDPSTIRLCHDVLLTSEDDDIHSNAINLFIIAFDWVLTKNPTALEAIKEYITDTELIDFLAQCVETDDNEQDANILLQSIKECCTEEEEEEEVHIK